VAGFKIGRGRGQHPGPAQQSGGQPPHPGQQSFAPPGSTGRPEYFDAPTVPGVPPRRYDDAPGHTQSFSVRETPGGYGGQPYQPSYDQYRTQPDHGSRGYTDPAYGNPAYDDQGYGDQGYSEQGYGDTGYAGYGPGGQSAPPPGPRLRWQDLLSGIVLRPGSTFWQMRDYQVWAPALIVTFIYGLLAVFGFDAARTDVLTSTFSNSIPWVLTTGVAVVICGVILGAVTHTLARQFGGDGRAAPTIGLAMLIMSLTDAPRLLFAIFLSGGNGLVQIIGWATWLACGALLTSMVSKSHDLPWQKALGASAIQLLALLVLFKLPTL
jgi:hypothetical protein